MKTLKYSLLLILLPVISVIATNAPKISKTKQVKSVVILGNSIVAHPVAPALGWNADWGMAASARDSDFVHRIINEIHKIDNSVMIRFQNIATFESGYDTYDLTQLATYQNADMLIVKISENVDQATMVSRNFSQYYDNLIKYLAPSSNTVKIIVDGFWPSTVNDIIRNYATINSYPFVTLPDLFSNDVSNSAQGLFANQGVANHPSDKGMRNIANRILAKISPYFAGNTWEIPTGWDGVTTTNWTIMPSVNDGKSAATPFLIENPEHLAKLAELVNSGNSYSGTYFKLTADLDLTNKNWTCIGSGSTPFSGTFDGNGHTISNLSITKWSNNIGLFAQINSATIKNLGIESGTIVCGGSNAGAIVGTSTGAANSLSYISDCYNKAIVMCGATDPRVYIGGIVGILLNNSWLDHCYNKGDITNNGNVSSNYTGGIVGAVASNSTVVSSYSAAKVIANTSKGGAIGVNWSAGLHVYYDTDLCIGTDAATQAVGNNTNTGDIRGLASTELKAAAFVSTLNSVGGSDWTAINGNYPILYWERISTDINFHKQNGFKVFSHNSSISIVGATNGNLFIITDIMGRTIRQGKINENSVDIDFPNKGIYVVRIGEYSTKLVM